MNPRPVETFLSTMIGVARGTVEASYAHGGCSRNLAMVVCAVIAYFRIISHVKQFSNSRCPLKKWLQIYSSNHRR